MTSSVFDLIDRLDDATDVRDLVRRLRPILNQLAYNAIAGDDAHQAHETWHEEYTERLYEAHAADATAAAATPAVAPVPKRTRDSGQIRRAAPPAGRSHGRGRKNPGDIPDSLRRIMEGTHESLRDDDD
jgi:hypothetical protein